MTPPLNQAINQLQEHAQEWQLWEKAIQGCQKFLVNSLEDDLKLDIKPLGGNALGDIILKERKQYLVFNTDNGLSPYIVTELSLTLKITKASSWVTLSLLGSIDS